MRRMTDKGIQMRISRLFAAAIGLFALFASLASIAAAPAHAAKSLTDGQEAVEASLSIMMIGVSGLDLQRGTFDATFYLAIDCAEECDAQGWDIVNARSLHSEITTEEPGSTWWRVSGTFIFEPNLQLFPFDTQRLPLVVEHKRLGVDAMVYVPNARQSEISESVSVPGWIVEPFTFTVASDQYASVGQAYSQATFELPIGRSIVASFTKYYIPLLIFVAMGASTLLLAGSDNQLRAGGTAILGLTIFYLATSGGVASVGYLTLWDASVLIGYVALGLVLLAGVHGTYVAQKDELDGEEGKRRDRRLRKAYFRALLAVVATGVLAITLVGVFT